MDRVDPKAARAAGVPARRGFSPLLVAVCALLLLWLLTRLFVLDLYKVPSGSMLPTLQNGDLILVNKFDYGLRLPLAHTRLTEGRRPARGDVMVFRFPPNPEIDYIKRVIAVPGDQVAYLNKKLTINGKPIAKAETPDYLDKDSMRSLKQYREDFDGKQHQVLEDSARRAGLSEADLKPYPNRDKCRYSVEGLVCTVPAGHYFTLGDNRDNSLDSRYWGFVPEQNIVGRAFFIWMNFDDTQRIGAIP